jgi:hypothetical protein
MISKESQDVVDNMTAGYIGFMTNIEADVIEPGRLLLNKTFAKTYHVGVDTARNESEFVLTITDDDDPSTVVEEPYEDLAELTDRIKQINEMADEEFND